MQDGCHVQTVATDGALEFIGAATLEGLTGREVFRDVYQTGKMMDHVHLSAWADLTIICPATANTINKLSAGIAEDAVGALALTHDFKKPLLIVPAMNHRMMSHPATQASLKKLNEFGAQVLPTGDGHQACGDVGPGRMLESDQILEMIRKALRAGGLK